MPAGSYNMTCEQGADFLLVLTWTDPSNALVDLTGWSARMQVRSHPGKDLITELTTTNGRISLGGAQGTITLSLDATITSLLSPQDGAYDLEMVSPGGGVTRLLQGDFSITPEVTV